MGLGFLIAHEAYRGYRVRDSQPMLYVAIGFLSISFGAVFERVLVDRLAFSIFLAGAVATTIVAVGMVVILHSLCAELPPT